jgi:hypothetical protein
MFHLHRSIGDHLEHQARQARPRQNVLLLCSTIALDLERNNLRHFLYAIDGKQGASRVAACRLSESGGVGNGYNEIC